MADSNVYPPSPEFVQRAHVKGMEGYRELYRRAAETPEEFWGELASKELFWFQKWTHVFEWNPPFVKWFSGGKIKADAVQGGEVAEYLADVFNFDAHFCLPSGTGA